MKLTKLNLIFLVLFLSNYSYAQFIKPVQISCNLEKITETTYDFSITMDMDSAWEVFGDLSNNEGPIGFSYVVERNKNLEIDTLKSIEKQNCYFSEIFYTDVCSYTNQVTFKQRIKITDPNQDAYLSLGIQYMTCNQTRCLPPDYVSLCVKLNTSKSKIKTIRVGRKKCNCTTN